MASNGALGPAGRRVCLAAGGSARERKVRTCGCAEAFNAFPRLEVGLPVHERSCAFGERVPVGNNQTRLVRLGEKR